MQIISKKLKCDTVGGGDYGGKKNNCQRNLYVMRTNSQHFHLHPILAT
jgi:hypothetical protein